MQVSNQIPIEKAVEIALEQHRAGHYKRAEHLYLEILRQDPGNVDAIHLLGVLAHQGGDEETSIQLISAAIGKRPDMPIFHFHLADPLRALGRRDEALAALQKAVELAPDYHEGHANLGNLLNEMGRFVEAESANRASLEILPDAPVALNNLGNSLLGQRKLDEAIEQYKRTLELVPDFIDAENNWALALINLGQVEEAVEHFRKAIQINPARHDLHNNLGAALSRLQRFSDAGASFQTAVDLKPDYAEAQNNLGSALRALGSADQAIPFFEKAVELNPKFIAAHNNLASALSEIGQKSKALEVIEEAIKLHPESPIERFMRAMILRDLNRIDEAAGELQQALKFDSNYVPALTSYGYMLLERGELAEAMEKFQAAMKLKPDPQGHSNVLMIINYHPGYTPADLLEAHRGWAELHENPLMAHWQPHTNDRDPDRRLRVGYVSPDFREHSVRYFLEPILQHHNREQFEIFAYAHLANTDMTTWRLRSHIDQWREISGKTSDEVAQQVRADQIDILIEVAGHTGGNALPTFARKPAPVQINMIGFPSTTGLSAIDYRVTDERCDPLGVSDRFNSEKLIRMPGVFWCYLPPITSPDVGPLPSATGRAITFTSVNNFTKVTPAVQKMWAQILAAVPGARLIIQTSAMGSEHTQQKILAVFSQEGVLPSRIEFRKSTGLPEYLQLLNESDMTLDPFPFNGGTTTCHSLWMGAPVVTLAGDRHASRMGLSMMTAIGLPEFVAYTPEEYVQIAVRFASDLPRLADIRAGMRDRLLASPLLDHAGYTRNLESAYRQVWQTWCASGT
jgi:protein O-GlcNAc transferase